MRLYTGRCELERIALATPPSSSGSSDADLQRKVELSRSLRASSQLSAYFAPIYGSQSMPRSRPQKVAIRAIASVEEVKEESAKLAHTIITVKRINKHSAYGTTHPCLALLYAEGLLLISAHVPAAVWRVC